VYKHAIIGNSAAATGALEAIRKAGDTGSIALFSNEPWRVYSRPLISYLLAHKVTPEKMYYRPEDFYEKMAVATFLEETVTALDVEAKLLHTDKGQEVGFEHLLIATGGVPFVPPMPGVDLDGVYTFTKWADVNFIEEYLAEFKPIQAVVIGGGLIGLKSAEALIRRGLVVTIVELADRIMSASFDKTASDLASEILQASGCRVITGDTAEELGGKEGRISQVRLKGGEVLPADLCIIAIGVRPNTTLLTGSSIEVNRGVITDHRMETNVKDIYAAGDVAEGPDLLLGIKRPIPIWPNAYIQGKAAGRNMGGDAFELDGTFVQNSIEVMDVATISAGTTDPGDDPEAEILVDLDMAARKYKKLVIKGNQLIGMVVFREVDRAGLYTGLIRTKADVSGYKDKLLSGDFGLLDMASHDHLEERVLGPGIEI
jgi:NAD(P)H-nitrite reductase large subunit